MLVVRMENAVHSGGTVVPRRALQEAVSRLRKKHPLFKDR